MKGRRAMPSTAELSTPKRRTNRDTWLAIGLIVLLLLISAAAGAQQTIRQNIPALASYSIRADGSRALREWLDALGYTTLDTTKSYFEIPKKTQLMLILEPKLYISDDEWTALDEWMEEGGVLFIAGEGGAARAAMDHFDFGLYYLSESAAELTLQTPWLAAPPLTQPIPVRANSYLRSYKADYVVHLAVDEKAVLVSLRKGEGWVILSAAGFPFSNAGLKEAGNPELVLNLLALTPSPAQVWFDEWHHGMQTNRRQVIGPGEWLRYTPTGQSLLIALGLILLALFLQGQGFGRAVRPASEIRRRGALEYVSALASLSRRAGHRRAVLDQLYFQLKRDLGRRYRIDPTLPDQEYIALLAQARPSLDAPALLRLFHQLKKTHTSEKEMIQLARQASSWINSGLVNLTAAAPTASHPKEKLS
jgi:hypothetical protein